MTDMIQTPAGQTATDQEAPHPLRVVCSDLFMPLGYTTAYYRLDVAALAEDAGLHKRSILNALSSGTMSAATAYRLTKVYFDRTGQALEFPLLDRFVS